MPIHVYRNMKKKKIRRGNKTYKISGTTTTGDTVIGDLLDRNMILIPIAITTLLVSHKKLPEVPHHK